MVDKTPTAQDAYIIAAYAELCAQALYAVDDIGREIEALLNAERVPTGREIGDMKSLAASLLALRAGFDAPA